MLKQGRYFSPWIPTLLPFYCCLGMKMWWSRGQRIVGAWGDKPGPESFSLLLKSPSTLGLLPSIPLQLISGSVPEGACVCALTCTHDAAGTHDTVDTSQRIGNACPSFCILLSLSHFLLSMIPNSELLLVSGIPASLPLWPFPQELPVNLVMRLVLGNWKAAAHRSLGHWLKWQGMFGICVTFGPKLYIHVGYSLRVDII